MSEVQSRPSAARGRGSHRGGRSGFGSRGGNRTAAARPTAGEVSETISMASLDEQGEIGQLKKKYIGELVTIKELFPDWTEDDLVFALQETDGDLQSTIERITEGNVSRFSDVKKKTKEKAKTKSKDAVSVGTEAHTATIRGRGRGGESVRGGRGRGSERGRTLGRGGRGASANGARSGVAPTSVIPSAESLTWDPPASESQQPVEGTTSIQEHELSGQSGGVNSSDKTAATTPEIQKSSLIPQGQKKSWASMLAHSKPLPPAISKSAVAVPQAAEAASQVEALPDVETSDDMEPTVPESDELIAKEAEMAAVSEITIDTESAADITPSKDQLTEGNLESLPDNSIPPATDTVTSLKDAASGVDSLTPSAMPQHDIGVRPPVGGYATSAWKATGAIPGRSSSFQRRMMEQREAVVMPGNHAVDRAAVQFGMMGLNGDSTPLDVDEEREAAETRAQPQQSPPSQPRTSLPPAPQQAQQAPHVPQMTQAGGTTEQPTQANIPTPKLASGPAAIPQTSTASYPTPPPNLGPAPSAVSQQGPTMYGRYGGGSVAQEIAQPKNTYDAFSQQLNYPQQNQQDPQTTFGGQSQQQSQTPQQGSYGQTTHEYTSQYGSQDARSSYQNYYGSYGQQAAAHQADQSSIPQRVASGLGSNDPAYATNQTTSSRLGDAHANSNNATPNPTTASGHSMGSQAQQGHSMQQPSHAQGAHSTYGYQNPYYSNQYYGGYMNQQYPGYSYNQGGYGGPYGGKYGQPHHGYGMSPQNTHDYSSSPANASGFGASSLPGRDSAFSGSLGEYGRSGSANPSQAGHTSNAPGFPSTMAESYGRSTSSLMNTGAGASQGYGQQAGSAEDGLKSYQEKSGSSPAPGQGGRNGSASGSGFGGQQQSNFPQPGTQGFGGYPGHLNQLHGNQNSQYGNLGGLGGQHGSAQSHQAGGYGSYGASFNSGYQGYGGRGGWGGNYGH